MIAMKSFSEFGMASITIRNLEQTFKERLRVRAARHGRSMEEEARVILKTSLAPKRKRQTMADAFRAWFGPKHGVNIELPERPPMREPPDFRA
jgi:antitoxin FitA